MKKANANVCCASILSLAILAGCNTGELRPAERADRASRSYANAMAELQAGRIDAAAKGFKEVLRMEPGNGDAHFQLAALLEDAKKDYVGAIVHYRMYLLLRPESDKAAVAADRMKGCETHFATVLVDKAGIDNKFAAELEKVRKEHSECAAKEAKTAAALDVANRKIAALERDIEMKKRMLEASSSVADASSVAKKARKNLRPTDAELLDDESDVGEKAGVSDEMKDIKSMLAEEDRTVSERPPIEEKPADGNASKAANPFTKKKDPATGITRKIPETYTVMEGDTLMQISARFYGTNRKWRDIREANRAIISPDGRVRAGQVIKLP